MNCPECGASLDVSNEIDIFCCTYCDSKFTSGDVNHINAQIRVKEMEYEERDNDRRYKQRKFSLLVFASILVFFMIMGLILVIVGDKKEEKLAQQNIDKIKVNIDNRFLSRENYRDV